MRPPLSFHDVKHLVAGIPLVQTTHPHNGVGNDILPVELVNLYRPNVEGFDLSASYVAEDSHCNPVTLHVYIPTSQLGILIGKSGSTISSIQALATLATISERASALNRDGVTVSRSDCCRLCSPVRVSIPPAVGSELWSPVVAHGEPAAVFAVARAITALSGHTDGCVLEVPLPRGRHATIIGSKGSSIRQYSADYNVRIAVPDKGEFLPGMSSASPAHRPDPSTSRGGKREVACISLEGDCGDVERCAHKILTDLFLGQEEFDKAAGGGQGTVVGLREENLASFDTNALMRLHAVEIKVVRARPGYEGSVGVEIKGRRGNVQRAASSIARSAGLGKRTTQNPQR